MQPKISKTLEGIIARSAFNTTKAGMTHSLKDFLTLELLREEGSLAYQLLSSRLKDWELYQVRLRIEREVISAKQQETRSPEEYYRDFTEELLAMPGVARSVSTAHALLAIISDRSTATARVLEMYGVTADSVDTPILPGTTCLLALVSRTVLAPQPCMGCGRCARVCHADLLPYEIVRRLENMHYERLVSLEPEACDGCGACSYVCPAGLDLAARVMEARESAGTIFLNWGDDDDA